MTKLKSMIDAWPTASDEQLAERQREAERDELRRRRESFDSFIGDRQRYRLCELSEFDCRPPGDTAKRKALEGVMEFIGELSDHRDSGTGALFYGPPGTGKDHLATCIIRAACLQHGHTAKYLNGIDWYGEIRDAMNDDRRTEKALMAECVRPDWLVLSDPLPPIGDLTVHQAGMLFRLMDARQSANKPTIVTVNVENGAEAVKRMGGATWDRMKDGVWVFPCAWPTFRKPAKEF